MSEVEPVEVKEEAAPGGSAVPMPAQSEMPFAIVHGQAYTDVPKDLYIPPDALEVILESFEGPLDLLLYLIRRQNIDILEIDVSKITQQYVAYVELMDAMKFELAAEYLVMAAMLAEIKSRMLLPRSSEAEDEEDDDPRATLIRRLQEYERFKKAAEDMDEIPRIHRDFHVGSAQAPDRNLTRPEPEVDLKELLLALSEVLRRADMFESHHVEKEKLSTRERMGQVLDQLRGKPFAPFVSLFRETEGRLGVVVTFLAVLELIKESLVEIVQTEDFGPIHVKARNVAANEADPIEPGAVEPEPSGSAEINQLEPLESESFESESNELPAEDTALPAADKDQNAVVNESFEAVTASQEPSLQSDKLDGGETSDQTFYDAASVEANSEESDIKGLAPRTGVEPE